MNYNLLEEPWMPVLYKDGNVTRVNILDAFDQAGRIREIAASNPMDRVAVLRFLLALLYWCQGNPSEKLPDESFPSGWFEGLKRHEDCFELFGEKKSFYQDQGAGGKPVAATNLLHDVPSGTNIAHFRHVRDFRDGLCPACCAMGLLRWAVVASAGTAGPGQQMTASINGNTPAYSFRVGANLFESLCLNWPENTPVQGDTPLWDGATEDSPLGILKGFTWQSRRALLAPADAAGKRTLFTGRCCYCGEHTDRLVKSILFRPGWERPSKEPWSDDPHLLRVIKKNGKRKEKKVGPSSAGPDDPLEEHAAGWRSIAQGLLQRSQARPARPARFETTLTAASQQLYKDAQTRSAAVPGGPNAIEALLSELEWLEQVTWRTTSARAQDLQKRPKGHAVIDALASKAAKGRAIRAGLCGASALVEKDLENAFTNLTEALASADQNDADAQADALKEWRKEVTEIICRNADQVTDLTTADSPLRRLEARDKARRGCRSALEQNPMWKEGGQI